MLIKTFVLILILANAFAHNSPNSSDIFVAHENTDNHIHKSSFGIVHKDKNNLDEGTQAKPGEEEDKRVILELRERHSDSDYRPPFSTIVTFPPTTTISTPVPIPKDEEDVIFIKNEREVERNGDRFNDYPPHADMMNMRDILKEDRAKTTEVPGDILFISGKNHENLDKNEVKSMPNPEKHLDTGRIGEEPKKKKKHKAMSYEHLDCSKMTRYMCNNTVKSVCGQRKENNQNKLRLFLNDCYFKKVNCDFKYEFNRYKRVPTEECRWITTRNIVTDRTSEFKAFAPYNDQYDFIPTTRPKTRRFMDGRQCSHPCPMMCPDDYRPECGESANGIRRVFTNHCEMDYNSCIYGTAWQKRPLSVCVGKMKAEIQENRRWIRYMQRMGLVDKKGHMIVPV